MSESRTEAARRLASRLMRIIAGLRYVGFTGDVKTFQRRLAFLRRHGVHARGIG